MDTPFLKNAHSLLEKHATRGYGVAWVTGGSDLRLGQFVPSLQTFPSNTIRGPELGTFDPSKVKKILLGELNVPVFHCDCERSQRHIVDEQLIRFEFPQQLRHEIPDVLFRGLSDAKCPCDTPNLGCLLKDMPQGRRRKHEADVTIKGVGS